MKTNYKYITLIAVLILFVFVISACSTSPGDRNLIETTNLSLDTVGDGSIIIDLEENRRISISSETVLELSEDAIIELEALPGFEKEFLFWLGDYNNQESFQRIEMKDNKELVAIFADPLTFYMAGNIEEAWGHNDVMGYWKIIVNNEYNEELDDEFEKGTIDLNVKETLGNDSRSLRVFDDKIEQEENGLSLGEIAYVRPQEVSSNDLTRYEYIAAILRVEEVANEDIFLFIYSDFTDIDILLWEESLSSLEAYEDALEAYNQGDEAFKDEVDDIITQNKNNESSNYLSGETITVNDPPISDSEN